MMRTTQTLLEMQDEIATVDAQPSEVLAVAVRHAHQAFQQAGGAVVELMEGDQFVYAAASGEAATHLGLRLSFEGSLSGCAVADDRPQLSLDAETDPRVDRDVCRRMGIRSMVIVPLKVSGRSRGVLKIHSGMAHAFDDGDILSAQLLALPIAYGLSVLDAQEAARRFQATFDQAAVGIAHVAPDGRFLRVNDRFCAIAGRTSGDLLEGGFQRITYPDDLSADLEQLHALLAGEISSYAMEKRYVQADGNIVWINLTVSLVRMASGAPDFFVSVIEDISARKAAEALAHFDPLTGLPNRRGLEQALDKALGSSAQGASETVVAFLDLDNFKSVNDAFGHDEGDRCLSLVADTLRQDLRQGDIVARIGGDEFVIVMSPISKDDGRLLLDRLEQKVRRLARGQGWEIGVSVGMAEVSAGKVIGRKELLKQADRLMYASKLAKSG